MFITYCDFSAYIVGVDRVRLGRSVHVFKICLTCDFPMRVPHTVDLVLWINILRQYPQWLTIGVLHCLTEGT